MSDLTKADYDDLLAAWTTTINTLRLLPRESQIRALAMALTFLDCGEVVGERLQKTSRSLLRKEGT